jgi:hypothetical protein
MMCGIKERKLHVKHVKTLNTLKHVHRGHVPGRTGAVRYVGDDELGEKILGCCQC